MATKIYIGTSGWHYKHWKGVFYPEKLKERDQLSFYSKSFYTVEINNSFYRLPSESTFNNWKDQVPTDFLFAVKANRYITHLKKLNEVAEYTRDFVQLANHLGKKLGPFLFQLPPSWKLNLDRLSNFAEILPKGYRYAFEFRNQDWYVPGVYEVLRHHNCAFCIYELAGHQSPIEITADFAYVRLHGPGGKYQGKYSDATMSEWADRCRAWKQKGKDIFFYFDNDEKAYAVDNAKTLAELLT
ncbi:DUF72 domain-containing protein [Parapedobacter sp. GCM10030251]|uniref:DUF72 domain-containing protein n=1 Tax=Parapedobacter sp. GCM10030251 TaxID=3273419 RepID=UPI00360BEA9A